jgi:hypothetical protein
MSVFDGFVSEKVSLRQENKEMPDHSNSPQSLFAFK